MVKDCHAKSSLQEEVESTSEHEHSDTMLRPRGEELSSTVALHSSWRLSEIRYECKGCHGHQYKQNTYSLVGMFPQLLPFTLN